MAVPTSCRTPSRTCLRYGNDGNDVLDGGEGLDTLNGGNGEDTYIFAKGYAQDTINEWGSDHSFIDLIDIKSNEITVSDQWGSNLLISVTRTADVLTISNYKWGQATYTIRFADGAEGYVDKDSWTLVLTKQPDPVKETNSDGNLTNAEESVTYDNLNSETESITEGNSSEVDTSTMADSITDDIPAAETEGGTDESFSEETPSSEQLTIEN